MAISFFLSLLLGALSPGAEAQQPVLGPWRAVLASPGGELPFLLEFADDSGSLTAAVINGRERLPVPTVVAERGTVTLGFDHYASVIEATLSADGRQLQGEWRKRQSATETSSLPFTARAGEAQRFLVQGAPEPAVTGRWRVAFASSEDPAVGVFEADAEGQVEGTFLTTTGDYRYLAGRSDADGGLLLSCFDGAHAFLFRARLQADGSLAGDFWSRDQWHETWTATADLAAQLPDAFALTTFADDVALADLQFPDLDGRLRSLDDPDFHGKARLIYVFGSWCPNCHDATEFLVELHQRYRARGLHVLGLAFEMTGDADRDAEQVGIYAHRHGVDYPLLVAGLADKAKASAALPLLDRVRSYPTTLFLDASGRIRGVHQGFCGPATGSDHRDLREQFVQRIEALLEESAS